mmetsp:Transcript_37649/g.55476  ORF Transcript_37649/g.55476 Transcript_37649/m.55476 type:complete len:170 (-) Transcript_37649:96-605(-)
MSNSRCSSSGTHHLGEPIRGLTLRRFPSFRCGRATTIPTVSGCGSARWRSSHVIPPSRICAATVIPSSSSSSTTNQEEEEEEEEPKKQVEFEFDLIQNTDFEFTGVESFQWELNGGEELLVPTRVILHKSGIYNLYCVQLTVISGEDGKKKKVPYSFPLQWMVMVNDSS